MILDWTPKVSRSDARGIAPQGDERDEDGMGRTARWFNHAGQIIEAPWIEGRQTTTNPLTRVTHYVFGSQSETVVAQAITLCGKRAGRIPGEVDVDCAECLDALDEDEE